MRGNATTLTGRGCLRALCGWLLLGVAGEAGAAIPASERAVLEALYNSTNGAGWNDRTNWRNPGDTAFAPPGTECTWFGVTCDGSAAHVTSVSLSINFLAGSIPPEIGNLGNLRALDLGRNLLTGSIPREVGHLTTLESLKLGVNQLSDSIPPEIGNLRNLRALDLGYNLLTGSIPPEIGNLRNLRALDLGYNLLTGSIPPEIGNLTSLVALYLSNNQLTGSIPPEIGNLTALRPLVLSDNQLTGAIPPTIRNLEYLDSLELFDNQLTGSIPPEIGNLKNLRHLNLSNNQLTDSIPPEIGHLTNLSSLGLASNQLSGPIPPGIGNITYLYWLDLSDNQLTGSIPPEIGNWDVLPYGPNRGLRLDHNRLTGSIPPEIGNLKNLASLNLSNNQLTGSIPPEIGNIISAPAWLWVSLNNNQLTGSIPPEIGKLRFLFSLDLGSNKLSGPIPQQIFNLRDLRHLKLAGNQLSGPIPAGIGNLTNLVDLDLGDNRLSGAVPAQFGNLALVSTLHLQGNQLRGPIPAALANMTELAHGSSDLRWNALHTSDAALRAFLNLKQEGGDWEGTQTVAPSGLAAGAASPEDVFLLWTPISYAGDTGGYRLWYSTMPGGPYNLGGTTTDKTISAFGIAGLSPGTRYYFVADTLTNAHADNQNTVTSERSAEVSATTTTGGRTWTSLNVNRHGPGTVASSPNGIACGGVCAAAFAPGTPVALTAAPGAGSTFLGWGGACAGTTLTCELTMEAALTVTAAFSPPAQSFYTVTPCRAYDSRDAGLGGPSPLAAGTDTAVVIGGYCGIPATAKAVSLNMTVVSPVTSGHLRLYASDVPRPRTSSVNYASGQTRANNAVVSLGADGALMVYVNQPSGTVHVVLDVNGCLQ